jgi:hypothetical protein
MILAIGIEHPLDMTVQRSHDANPRHHRVAAAPAQHQRLDRGLPFRQVGFFLRQLRDVVCRVLQREQLPAVGQNNGILKRGRPGHGKSFFKNEGGAARGDKRPLIAQYTGGTSRHLRDCCHARLVWIGRNETRVLSLMFVAEVKSGTSVVAQEGG